jgi:hypothetical protein
MGKQRKFSGKRKSHETSKQDHSGNDAADQRTKRLKIGRELQEGRKLIVILEDCSLEVGKVFFYSNHKLNLMGHFKLKVQKIKDNFTLLKLKGKAMQIPLPPSLGLYFR